MSFNELVCVKKYLNRYEAEIQRSILDVYGIEAHVFSSEVGGTYPSLSFGGGYRLMVRKEKLKNAIKLLQKD